MYQQESIYNLVSRDKIVPVKEKTYKSIYPSNLAPTASTFNLINSSYPNVANLSGDFSYPRGAHPLLGKSSTFGLPEGGYRVDPSQFHKKGNTFKILPPLERIHTSTEIRKPSVPTLKDKPIMGLKTEKNYIISNAVDAILMQPKQFKMNNDFDSKYKNYGKVPKYISGWRLKVEEEYNTIKEVQRKREEEEEKKQRLLTEEEVCALREGLKKKWEMYNHRYGKFTHKKAFDNLVLIRNKEGLEKKLGEIEEDMKKISTKNVVLDFTKQ